MFLRGCEKKTNGQTHGRQRIRYIINTVVPSRTTKTEVACYKK